MNPSFNRNSSLLGLFDHVLDDGMAFLEDRADLLLLELQEEKWRLVDLLIRALVAVMLAGFTILTVTALVVYLLWSVHPVLALGLPALLYGAGAIWISWTLYQRTFRSPRPFKESLEQFKKDRQCFQIKN